MRHKRTQTQVECTCNNASTASASTTDGGLDDLDEEFDSEFDDDEDDEAILKVGISSSLNDI